ncbi:hypothetical protein [Niastella populi]|uniref:hypothetical protein n=1 Tax=Niastella populi TaxID=550983 RepID=UPI0009BFE332|nr:hypothetical protein [Niastella populi]
MPNQISKARDILIATSTLVDKKFLAQRQLINFHEFMERHEYELALDSLIELSDEVEDRFTYEFWLNLDKAAGLMELTHIQEIIKNKISDFWFNQAKNFSLKEKEIEAEIQFLTTEEGGRSSFIYSGYRGTFHYDGQYNSAAQEFIGQVKCYPGNIVNAYMAFAAPEAQIGRLYEGLIFDITEGARIVAHGTILKIFRKDLVKT